MKLILCVDVDNGMTFNDRRQSRDREVIKDIARYVGDGRIIISEYSRILFGSVKGNVVVFDFEKEESDNILLESDKANVLVSDFEKEEMNDIVFDADKNENEINDDNLKYKNDKNDKNDKTDIFDKIDEQDVYFIEKVEHLNKINWNKIDELILYRWDKKYPTDCSFYVDNDKFRLNNILEFQGFSHDKITREVYEKYEG